MHLYVTEQGAKIRKSGEHLFVCKDNIVLEDCLLESVEALLLFGSVQPSVEVMTNLLANGSVVSFLSRSGHFKGRLVSSTCKNVPLRLKQYDAFRNPEMSFSIAKNFIERKLMGGFHLLEDYNRNSHNEFRFEERTEYISNLERLRNCEGNDKQILRGYEGLGARLYFQSFARCLKHGIVFPGRIYYPSTDPVNALLSFGYSFVARELEALLESVGIDPMIGFLHEPFYGRASLAMDLLEEFRHPFVDRLVLSLFNKRHITIDDFECREVEGKNGQLYLKAEAVKVFIQKYEDFCNGPNKTDLIYRDYSWRQIFRKRVENLRRFFMLDTQSNFVEFMENSNEVSCCI